WTTGLDGAYINFTNPPANQTGIQSKTATFTASATSGYQGDTSTLSPTIAYQWQRAAAGSSTFVSIAGANGTSYTTPVLTLADSGAQYRLAAAAGNAVSNSSSATLSVSPDTAPPRPVAITRVTAD